MELDKFWRPAPRASCPFCPSAVATFKVPSLMVGLDCFVAEPNYSTSKSVSKSNCLLYFRPIKTPGEGWRARIRDAKTRWQLCCGRGIPKVVEVEIGGTYEAIFVDEFLI